MRDGEGGAAKLKNEIASLRAKVIAELRAQSILEIVSTGLNSIRSDPRFFSNNESTIRATALEHGSQGALAGALQRLDFVGVSESDDPPENERYHLEQRNLDLLSGVLLRKFLSRPATPLYVDPRLSTAKHWRDVYQYSNDGTLLGWSRFLDGEKSEFTAEGKLILSRKPDGSPDRVSPVRYTVDPKTKRLTGLPTNDPPRGATQEDAP